MPRVGAASLPKGPSQSSTNKHAILVIVLHPSLGQHIVVGHKEVIVIIRLWCLSLGLLLDFKSIDPGHLLDVANLLDMELFPLHRSVHLVPAFANLGPI